MQRDAQRENGMEASSWREKQKGAGLGLEMFASRIYSGTKRWGAGVEPGGISNSGPHSAPLTVPKRKARLIHIPSSPEQVSLDPRRICVQNSGGL